MRLWPRILLFATLLATAFLSGSLASTWLPDGGLRALSLYVEAAQRSDLLDHAADQSRERIRLKTELSRSLADGRISLAEAMQQVVEHDPDEDFANVPGQSTEERCGRALIRWVTGQLRHDAPARLQEVVARLEHELSDYLAHRRPSAV